MNTVPTQLAALPTALLGFGEVRHTRLRPTHHAFVYPTYFLMLPMRTLRATPQAALALPVNRAGWLGFDERDHGDGRGTDQGGALGWLEELLASEAVDDVDGEIWLQTYPRVLGYAFKPVSFWYVHRADGSLRAIVAEVNNTFGERHCYLLDAPHWGAELSVRKVFHVSPFCKVEGRYRFRFLRTQHNGVERVVARIEYDDGEGPLIQTALSGALEPASASAMRRAFWRYPAQSFGVIARIHWHALRLWLARVPFHAKPEPPSQAVTRQS